MCVCVCVRAFSQRDKLQRSFPLTHSALTHLTHPTHAAPFPPPQYVEREDFFGGLYEVLQGVPEIKELSAVPDAHVPVLKMDFSGFSVRNRPTNTQTSNETSRTHGANTHPLPTRWTCCVLVSRCRCCLSASTYSMTTFYVISTRRACSA